MSYYLRKFSLSKWQPNRQLKPSDYSADAITGCTRTTENKLSVWTSETIDFSSEEVEKLIVALATTMTEPATIDLIWLDNTWLVSKGIILEDNPAKTKFRSINGRHRDLANLNHDLLSVVGEHIVLQLQDNKNYKKILRNELIALVAKWINKEEELSIGSMKEKWKDPINKFFEDQKN